MHWNECECSHYMVEVMKEYHYEGSRPKNSTSCIIRFSECSDPLN